MKIIIWIILFIGSGNLCLSKETIPGKYYNYFGSRIILNEDSTFKYNWNQDLASSWSYGQWSSNNDTIQLTIPILAQVFFTVSYLNYNC